MRPVMPTSQGLSHSTCSFPSGYHAMRDCGVLLMLGTDFPYRQFYPEGSGVRIAQVDLREKSVAAPLWISESWATGAPL